MRRFIKEPEGKKPQVWEVTVSGNTVRIVHGALGSDKMQETTTEHDWKLKGKKNQKTPEEVAKKYAEDQIKKKVKDSYFEVDPETNEPIGEKSETEIRSYVKPPEGFRAYKPQHHLSKKLEKALRKGSTRSEAYALIGRKRDGYMHYLVTDEYGYTRLFSSKWEPAHNQEMEDMIPWLERYPHIEADLKKLNLPPRTILLGEICSSVERGVDKHGFVVDDFEYVGGVIKSLTPLSLKTQERYGQLSFCVWDIAVWEGNPISKTDTVGDRYHLIYNLLASCETKWVTMPELIVIEGEYANVFSYDAQKELQFIAPDFLADEFSDEECENFDPIVFLLKFAKVLGWEGYVIADPQACYGEKAFNFRGKNDRPVHVGKLKPDYEADFVVKWDPDHGVGEWGTGKNKNGVGSVQAYLYDDRSRDLVPVSKVGGGISDEDSVKFADPSLYPMVWKVVFKAWTAKGSLRHPSFDRVRDDKKPEECSVYQNPRWSTV